MKDPYYYLNFSKYSDIEDKKDRRIYRFLETIPGMISWTIILSAIILSRFFPVWTASFIIVFVIYWVLRSVYFSIHLKRGYSKMKINEKEDWILKLNLLEKYSLPVSNWKEIYHLVVVPIYKESVYILRNTLKSISENDYPLDRVVVVLAVEERSGEETIKEILKLKNEFKGIFLEIILTIHPKDIPGEIAGKSSNEAWGTKVAKKEIIDQLKIPYENIILTSLDSDTVIYPKYFSCLTHYYLTSENPTRTSFQPIPLYINNIWEAPPLSRVFSFSSTFWHTINQERPEKLITFSSHSMSFKALVDIGFKQTNVVSEDSRVFWQAILRFDGNYRTVPIHYPVSMDANVAPSFLKTTINVYKQNRRWAYGVENIPYFLFGFLKNKKISFKKKFALGFEVIEGQISWATAPILIYVLGWLPIVLGRGDFRETVISYSLPIVLSRILTFAMIGLIGSIYFSILLLPPKPAYYGKFKFFVMIAQWIIIPFTMIFFSSFPALEAQTRLMFKKYMGFWPTPKFRKNENN
jgi:hypothetical protein